MKRFQLNKTPSVMAIASLFMLAGCENANQNTDSSATSKDASKSVSVMMKSKSDSTVTGQVNYKEHNDEVSMKASFSGLDAGAHAIHIHANADCTAADETSAGGHWNPTNEKHGQWGSKDGYHKGDIGNFDVNENGKGRISMQTNQWCIGCEDKTKNILNHAVIVHQGADDFVSQPSGGAGARVACGEITQ